MLILDAIQYLGQPPESKGLDAYLKSIGLEERPVYREVPVEDITRYDDGFSLIFSSRTSYEKWWEAPTEPGDLIFSSLQVYSARYGEDFSEYTGPLPYGLTFDTTPDQAKLIFGEPTTDNPSGPENRTYAWYNHGGYTVSVCFLPDNKGIGFVFIERAKKKPPKKLDW
ncbi:hypothetical protein [Ralstonia pseudosolanacearum]|uniref:Uncharacterized protein n=1 Tax=Ralstonia solanacearum TaxID=305 RepID=A0A0S4WZE3_RALSL|nr:hypothetical protein [Ralstonia sp. RS650]UZF14022.1 hypothetical protein LH706_13410 [Ralstonia solanacearum]UZF29152.1 hypothetical protein LGV82_13415 [Ralstonia sp. RS650]CUV57015.1 protein of unknown function [Ralstonia solanacearum]